MSSELHGINDAWSESRPTRIVHRRRGSSSGKRNAQGNHVWLSPRLNPLALCLDLIRSSIASPALLRWNIRRIDSPGDTLHAEPRDGNRSCRRLISIRFCIKGLRCDPSACSTLTYISQLPQLRYGTVHTYLWFSRASYIISLGITDHKLSLFHISFSGFFPLFI